jgi:hypothetical protein
MQNGLSYLYGNQKSSPTNVSELFEKYTRQDSNPEALLRNINDPGNSFASGNPILHTLFEVKSVEKYTRQDSNL